MTLTALARVEPAISRPLSGNHQPQSGATSTQRALARLWRDVEGNDAARWVEVK